MADPENQDTEKAPSLTKEYIIPGIIKTAEFVSSFLIVYYTYPIPREMPILMRLK